MGALVHGQACYGYTFLLNIKHGSNVTIETLHRVLQDRFESNGKQPFKQRVLYLQLDNTTKQCKSKYVFCYLALLVAWFLFSVVMLSFLMVGHTHEDIDQLFSRIATYLRKNNATSRIGFREAILKAFKGKWTDKVVSGDIESAANVSDWLKDKIHPMSKKKNGMDQREGITEFHQFKFSLLQGVPIMQVRKWCGDKAESWRGLMPNSTHHVIFSGEIPTPADLARDCPPAQRSTKPTDPAYQTLNRAGAVISNHTSKVRAGVETLIENRHITGEAEMDLRKCLDLMESTAPLPFHWNMEMYNVHLPHRGPTDPKHFDKDLQDEGEVSANSREDDNPTDYGEERKQLQFDDDDEVPGNIPVDKEGYAPPPILVGETYLVKLGTTEWGLARIMVTPFIGMDECYAVHVMWLDPVDLDMHIQDQYSKRFIVNKRSSTVHPKGWEELWARSLDMRIIMTSDGTYNKIPNLQKSLIIGRIQSWILQEAEAGQPTTNLALPLAKPKLRPGQSKIKEKKTKTVKPSANITKEAPPKANTKPPKKKRSRKFAVSSAGNTHNQLQYHYMTLYSQSPPMRITALTLSKKKQKKQTNLRIKKAEKFLHHRKVPQFTIYPYTYSIDL